MATTLGELARLVGGVLQGAADLPIVSAATLETAGPADLTFADHPDRLRALQQSPAAAALVPQEFPPLDKPTIAVADVASAFAAAVCHFRPPRVARRSGVSPLAAVSPTARLGRDVEVHPYATIGDDVVIGDGCTIHAGVHILAGCRLGNQVTLFPNAVLYEDTLVGDRCLIHAGAVLGAYGFGYRQEQGRHVLSAQLGYVEVGSDVEIGAGATVDRGTYGPTRIGDGTKIDNLVMIAHNCQIGRHNLLCSQAGIAGSSSTGDGVVMAGQVGVRDHVRIGTGAVLCSKAGVSNDVPDAEVMLGQPATPLRQQKLQMAAVAKLPEMRREFRELQRTVEALRRQLDANSGDASQDQAA